MLVTRCQCVAAIVRQIFRMTMEGSGPSQIAKKLPGEKYRSPAAIRQMPLEEIADYVPAWSLDE